MDITTMPWLPFAEGRVSLKDALVNAGDLTMIETKQPLELAAAYRYLASLFFELRTSQGVSAKAFDAYMADKVTALYGDKAWLQADCDAKPQPVSVLRFDVPTGTERALDGFGWHGVIPHDDVPLTLLTHHLFAQGRGAGYYPAATPRLMAFPVGRTLLETLQMIVTGMEVNTLEVKQTRLVKLLPDSDGVRMVKYKKADKVVADTPDVMGCWLVDDSRYVSPPRRMSRERALERVRSSLPPVVAANPDSEMLIVAHAVDKGKQFHSSVWAARL